MKSTLGLGKEVGFMIFSHEDPIQNLNCEAEFVPSKRRRRKRKTFQTEGVPCSKAEQDETLCAVWLSF